jgi:DNA-binding GntR family transcriptional regulator
MLLGVHNGASRACRVGSPLQPLRLCGRDCILSQGMAGATPTRLSPSAAEAATKLIRDAILRGGLPPGERLKEEALAQSFEISRTPVREALRILQMEGLVDFTPNRGATVRTYTVDDLREIYTLRAMLEGHAARRAAQWMTPETLRRLEGMCERFAALRAADAPVDDLVHENVAFHQAIIAAAGSPRLADVTRRVVEMPLVYRGYRWYTAEQRRQAERDHFKLLRAFETHDADRAELVMRHHILEGGDVILEHLTAAPFDRGEGDA